VSLGYLWERRRGVYGILPKSEGVFSSTSKLHPHPHGESWISVGEEKGCLWHFNKI